jgi:hypothetical protein
MAFQVGVCWEEGGGSLEGVPEGCGIAGSETIGPAGPNHRSETAGAHTSETIPPAPRPPRPKPAGIPPGIPLGKRLQRRPPGPYRWVGTHQGRYRRCRDHQGQNQQGDYAGRYRWCRDQRAKPSRPTALHKTYNRTTVYVDE